MAYSRSFQKIARELYRVAVFAACFSLIASAELKTAEVRRPEQNLVQVKYRSTPVNVGDPRFEYLDTSRSSFVTGAWYDRSTRYVVIGLRRTYYHYCQMPSSAWVSFRDAQSFGSHYNRFIKGNYDCRLGGVPAY